MLVCICTIQIHIYNYMYLLLYVLEFPCNTLQQITDGRVGLWVGSVIRDWKNNSIGCSLLRNSSSDRSVVGQSSSPDMYLDNYYIAIIHRILLRALLCICRLKAAQVSALERSSSRTDDTLSFSPSLPLKLVCHLHHVLCQCSWYRQAR